MKTILNIEDLYKISDFLVDNGYGEVPLTITIDVLTKERLDKINEELFYKYNTDKDAIYSDVDEIHVTINNLTFKYALKENDSENQE